MNSVQGRPPSNPYLFPHSGGDAFNHGWLHDRRPGRQVLAGEELVGKSLLGLHAFLHVHVERAVEEIGEVVQFDGAGTALGDAASGVVYPALDVTADLLLLFDFAD